jgi:hypothetical protein
MEAQRHLLSIAATTENDANDNFNNRKTRDAKRAHDSPRPKQHERETDQEVWWRLDLKAE